MRNLDLLVLLSFSVSLWFFNRGDIFTAVAARLSADGVPARADGLVGLARRARRGRGRCGRSGLLAAATVFLVGFRIGLNVRGSNVIDVGYSGVIGARADRRTAQSPYGHMPRRGA